MTKFNVNQYIEDYDSLLQTYETGEEELMRIFAKNKLQESVPSLEIFIPDKQTFRIDFCGKFLCVQDLGKYVFIPLKNVPKVIKYLQNLDFETPAKKRDKPDD